MKFVKCALKLTEYQLIFLGKEGEGKYKFHEIMKHESCAKIFPKNAKFLITIIPPFLKHY